MTRTSLTIDDISSLVEIDSSFISLLAETVGDFSTNFTKAQVRAVVLGDFLAKKAGINPMVSLKIVKQVVVAISIENTEDLAPILQILDYDAVILTTCGKDTPLFILDHRGLERSNMPKQPPTMILTVILDSLFKKTDI